MLTSTLGSMSPLIPLATDALIKATILLALVAVVAHLLRRSSAALRHLLWTLAIVGIVAMPVLITLVPFHLNVLPAATSASSIEQRERGPSAPADRSADQNRVDEVVSTFTQVAAEQAGATPIATRAPLDIANVIFVLWLAGALLMLARFVVGSVIVRGIARRATTNTDASWRALADRCARALGLTAPVEVRLTDEVEMPFVCGLIQPTIVLPLSVNEWSPERREAVLMHEFAHISRGDLAMNTLSHVARALYWFHPLAWLAAHRLRVEGERACDDAVLRAGARPSDYAEHLLSIVRTVGNTVPGVALAMARRSDFEGRMLAILEAGVPRGGLTRWRAAGMAAVFLVAVMPLAAMAPAIICNSSTLTQLT